MLALINAVLAILAIVIGDGQPHAEWSRTGEEPSG